MCVFFSFPFFLPTSEGSFAWGSGQRVAVRCLSMLSREQGDGSESAAAALLPPCCFFHCRPPPFSSTKAIWTYYFKREKEKKKKKIRSLPLPRYPGAAVEARSETLTFWWDRLTGRKRAGCAPRGWGDQQVSYISLVPSCACFHALVSSIY